MGDNKGRAFAERQKEVGRARRAQVLKLSEAGKTQVEIAKRLGVTRSRIYAMLRQAREELAQEGEA